MKTQGMCQGNGAAPMAWTVTSIPMIAAHKRKGQEAHFIAPISDITGHIVGGFFVDDTDLVHVDMQVMEMILEAHSWLQESVINWGHLLITTGVDKFRIMVEIAPLPVCLPREGDKWFMQATMEAGVTDPNKQRIPNQFRCHQQVLYVSDVLDAGGKCLDKKYLDHWKPDELWLTLVFPQEKPSKSIFTSGDRCFTL